LKGKLIIGTRGSQLALWQSEWVKREIESKFPSVTIDLQVIKTKGDKILDSPLSKIVDKGLFTREIEYALLDSRIDLAVHSLKDIPTETPKGLTIGAITKRDDVRDVFISKKYNSLDELPKAAKIATGSLRRKAQLLHYRPDLNLVDIRGNLNTRFKKFDESDWDGMILAYAGVERLGLSDRIKQIIPTDIILPAVGQGALAVEVREDDREVQAIVKRIHHAQTAFCAVAERGFLKFLEGGCQVPIAAYARVEKGKLKLDGMIGSLNGDRIIRGSTSGDKSEAESLGARLGRQLYQNGGADILKEIRMITTS